MKQSELIELIRLSKESAFWFRRRRHPDWIDNYTLYRDKVQLNRLTQRQSVNIPLMKYSIKTLLKDIDDAPMLYFTNLDNDDQAELFYNEYWKYCARENKNTIKDIVDKRQVLLFGRSFKKLNILDGRFYWEVIDPQDILVDRYIDPANLDTSRFLIHEHIYKPLSSLLTNPLYDKKAVLRLQQYYSSEDGVIKAEQNQLDWVEKQSRLAAMGDIQAFNPQMGETYVELNECFMKIYDPAQNKDVIQFVVVADGMEVLFNAPQEEVIGKTTDNYWQDHYAYTTWADETERTDFWSDSVADTLRQLNKILNAWFSQLVENRTLRSFGMNYFNSSLTEEGFTPQTFEPVPWGWYPMPVPDGTKIADNVVNIPVPDLGDSLQEMQFIKQLAEQASAATTFQQGEAQPQQITLGEVQLLLQNAQERVKSMAIYYTDSWKEFGTKYVKMLEAAGDMLDEVQINKKGKQTKKQYVKTVGPKDWETKLGYIVDVQMKSEKEASDANDLQWLNAGRSLMPHNQMLDTIYKKKILENSNLNSEEIEEVLKEDKQQSEQLQQMQPTIPQIKPPSEMINFKDLPQQGQMQMAKQAHIDLGQQQPMQLGPGQQQPTQPQVPNIPMQQLQQMQMTH